MAELHHPGLIESYLKLAWRQAKVIQMNGCMADVEKVLVAGRITKLERITPAYAKRPYVFATVTDHETGKEKMRPAFEFYYSKKHKCFVAEC